MPVNLPSEYDKLRRQSSGTAMGAMNQSDINRGVMPGNATPGSESMNPTDLAQIDRYAWGQQAGLGGLPVAAGYEGLKAVSQLPGLSSILPVVAGALGFEHTADQFNPVADTSSPASLGNIGAYIQGATRQHAEPSAYQQETALKPGQGGRQPLRQNRPPNLGFSGP